MRKSKAQKVSASLTALTIWAWLLRPSETQNTPKPTVPCDQALERQKLEERLSEVQRETRCVHRAIWLMVFLMALAVVGVGYTTVLLPFWPQTMTQFLMHWSVKAHCVLGLASLSCAIVFAGIELRYRKALSLCRAECNRLTMEAIEAVAPRAISLPAAEESDFEQCAA